ncbi:MAG: MBL fold metallo-hydrolase [Lentisphaerae bacterium]|nr:MBL fold metallo-hydrolase [Lentisphaerota bacterium]
MKKELFEKNWQKWRKGELQIHFIHTGVAESILFIFPDGTTMLNDCGDYPALTRWQYAVPVVPGPERLAGDWIARYAQRVLPENAAIRNGKPLIDYMYLSHFHCDHCGTPHWQCIKDDGDRLPGCYRSGFALAAEALAFDTAVDRDWPGTGERKAQDLEHCHEHMHRIYDALRQRDGLKNEKFRLGADDQFILRYAPADFPDFKVHNFIANGRIFRQDGTIKDVYAEEAKHTDIFNENGMSTGFILTYGDFTFFTGGDWDDAPITGTDGGKINIDDALAEELFQVDVAKINHHGFRNMSDKLVAALAPRVWVANISNTREVSEDALERICDRKNYPGARTVFPCVFADSRIEAAQGKDYLQYIAPETFGKGCHVVITVPAGGKEYRVTCIDAADESMTIKGEYQFACQE